MEQELMWIAVTPDEYELIISFGMTQIELSKRLGVRPECIPRNYQKSCCIPVGAPHKTRERMRIRKILLDKEA